ncbi:MAG: DUF1704 domain-containing protein [Myxococcales bacterium]|nr:DUF1704 domain-containing protein [Myxococcales bacterium]
MNTGEREIEAELGRLVREVAAAARLLPALTGGAVAAERHRLTEVLRRGGLPVPRYRWEGRRVDRSVWSALARARRLCSEHPLGDLYAARLEELDLELHLMEALGDPRRIRPLAARRFGTGRDPLIRRGHPTTLHAEALEILETTPMSREKQPIPSTAAPGAPSLEGLMRGVAHRAGLAIDVRVEPRLLAAAATGDRVVYIADRTFGIREAFRLATHEVLGHLVAAANARHQPLGLLQIGTAGSFTDQEGLCLFLEEQAGWMDALRLRTLAARVLASDRMHHRASFGETARDLVRLWEFTPEESIALTERAYRGGGVARDVGYLRGLFRVREAIESGASTVDELRSGKVSLDALAHLRSFEGGRWLAKPHYRPSLADSLVAMDGGTRPSTLPPNVATSFTRLELT